MPSIFDNPAAFAPFFGDDVMVRGATGERRHVAAAMKCCVFDRGFADAYADDSTASGVRMIEVLFPVREWPYPEPPLPGDVCEWDGIEYAVTRTHSRMGDWVLEARQKTGVVNV